MSDFNREELAQIAADVSPHLIRTPMWPSRTLSALTKCDVHLKAELFQKTGSYKPRGMLWALKSMSDEQRERGVITFSAGNAAQGLAYAGGILGVDVTVVMPATASPAKAEAARGYGAEVVLQGTPRECLAHCRQLAAERQLTFLSSYDDIDLIHGHATLGLELIEDLADIDAVYVGVGGGGMLAGIALALDACGSPARLYGVEPEGAPAMHHSFETGYAVELDSVNTIADGLAAPGAGAQCYTVARRRTESILLVSDAEILTAMRLLMERCKLYVEPAGAASLAGLIKHRGELRRRARAVCIVSGGNLDLVRLVGLFSQIR